MQKINENKSFVTYNLSIGGSSGFESVSTAVGWSCVGDATSGGDPDWFPEAIFFWIFSSLKILVLKQNTKIGLWKAKGRNDLQLVIGKLSPLWYCDEAKLFLVICGTSSMLCCWVLEPHKWPDTDCLFHNNNAYAPTRAFADCVLTRECVVFPC